MTEQKAQASKAAEETPYEGLDPIPPILGRGLIYLIMGLGVTLLAWAYWSRVEVVVAAEGAVIPMGEAAKVQAAQGGVVSEILVKEGQSVRRGDALVRLEALQQTSSLLKAMTEYENTKSLISLLQTELSTYKGLAQEGVISKLEYIAKQKEFETSSRKLRQLESEIQVAKAGEAKMTITAPAEGTVAFLKVFNEGQVVTPSEILATVIPDGVPLVMELKVLNKDISKIRVGHDCKHKLDAFPFQDFGVLTGRVVKISPDADRDPLGGRSYRVTADFEKTYYQTRSGRLPIRPGLTGTTEIITERRRLLTIFLEPFRKLRAGISIPS